MYQPDQAPDIRTHGQELEAPGVLAQPVPVAALYDEDEARRVTLRNLLLREGYESLDAVREEGQAQGLRRSLLTILTERGLEVDTASRARIEAADGERLARWIVRALHASSVAALFEP